MNRAQRLGIVLGVAPDSAASLLILRLKVSRKNRRVTRSIAERTRSCSFTFLVLSNALKTKYRPKRINAAASRIHQ